MTPSHWIHLLRQIEGHILVYKLELWENDTLNQTEMTYPYMQSESFGVCSVRHVVLFRRGLRFASD